MLHDDFVVTESYALIYSDKMKMLSLLGTGVAYRDVNSDSKLDLFASLMTTTDFNYLKSLHQKALHLNVHWHLNLY